MSGDNFHGKQPMKFYCDEMTTAKKLLIVLNGGKIEKDIVCRKPIDIFDLREYK